MKRKKLALALSIILCISMFIIPKLTFAASSIQVTGYNMNTNSNSNSISFNLKLKNTGTTSLALSTVKLRYYFTSDSNQATQYACDYSSVGSNNVTGTFGTTTNSNYFEIGFTNAAGNLAVGAEIPLNMRIWKSDWSNFNQADDYSYNATATTYVVSNKVTGYIGTSLVWGTELGTTNPPTDDPQTPPSDDPQNPPSDDPQTPPSDDPQTPPSDDPQNPPSGNMKEISDAYMRNIQISTDCPSNVSSPRSGVAYGTITHKTYYSTTTRSQRGVNILLPANYTPQKQYPVLYLLHGIFGDENSMIGNSVKEITANLAADGKAAEMIVVFPNIYADAYGRSPGFDAQGMAGYDNFVNDLVNDLMPYIRSNYSVKTDRKYQAIAGFSMGGREALYIGITRPDIFGYVMGISPAPGLTPGQDMFANHPGQLSENNLKIANLDNMPYAIMICCGTNDSVVGTFPQSYHNILTRNNTNHIWYQIPGADHDNRAIASGIYNFVGAIFHAQ